MASLPLAPPKTVHIGGSNFSYDIRGGKYHYYASFDAIGDHDENDCVERNRMIGRLARHGDGVRISDLSRAFGISRWSVMRYRDKYRDGGPDAIGRIRKPRGPARAEFARKAEAERLLAEGMSVVRVAEKMGVHFTTLYQNLRKGRIEAPARGPSRADAPKAGGAFDRTARDLRDRLARMGRGAWNVKQRLRASRKEIQENPPDFKAANLAVHGAGVLAALPWLLREGLLSRSDEFLSLPKGYFGVRFMLTFNAFFLLRRLTPAQALRGQPPGEWGPIMGDDRAPCDKTYHLKMDALSENPERVEAWARSLMEDWAADIPDEDVIVMADTHFYSYFGDNAHLPKNWVSSENACLPSTAVIFANYLGSMPLSCIYKKLNRGLGHALEHDMVPEMRRSGLIGPDAPNLLDAWAEAEAAWKIAREAEKAAKKILAKGGDAKDAMAGKTAAQAALATAVEKAGAAAARVAPAMTLVFDREAWSPALFRRLSAQGVAVITWHKGFAGEGWPEEEFVRIDVPSYGPFGIERESGYRIAERTILLTMGSGKNAKVIWVRQIRRLMPDGRQVAFVTNNFSVPLKRVAGAMFSRWSQENFFKYMKREFGLGKMSSYDFVDLDPDTRIVNPRWREADKKYDRLRKKLGRRRNRAADLEKSIADGKGGNVARKLELVEEEIDELAREVEAAKIRRKELPRHILAGELPEEEKLQAIVAKRNLLLDLIRMICFRAETRMTVPFMKRGIGHRPRVKLRELFQADADIIPDHENGILRVRVLGGADNAADASLAPLFEELNRTETIYPGTNLRLVYEQPK